MLIQRSSLLFLKMGGGIFVSVGGGGEEGGGWCTSPLRTLHKGQIEFLVSANCSPPEMGQSGNVSGGVALVEFFCLFLLVGCMPFNVGLLLFYVCFLSSCFVGCNTHSSSSISNFSRFSKYFVNRIFLYRAHYIMNSPYILFYFFAFIL